MCSHQAAGPRQRSARTRPATRSSRRSASTRSRLAFGRGPATPASGSSSTSSRTSTSSSTSDPTGGSPVRAATRGRSLATTLDLLRLGHPFPSLLNGLVTGALVLIAGGGAEVAARLGLAMTALQVSIGALNDVVDAPIDRGRRPPKPVADGLVTPRVALGAGAVAAIFGFGLAAISGPATLAVAVLGAGCGYAYDLRLSRTAASWVPLA